LPRFHVLHRTHDGTNLAMFYPENLSFTMNKGENGPHEVTYELPTANDAAELKNVVPYWTDFELYRENEQIFGGMVTSVSFSSEDECIRVAGKSWLHYFEKRHYPFDPTDPAKYQWPGTPRGIAYQAIQKDISEVLHFLLQNILFLPNSLELFWDLGTTGRLMDYQISLGDTTSLLARITEIAQQEPGIFDFWISNDKWFHIQMPRRYSIDVLVDATLCQWTFVDTPSGLLSVNFTDNGPEGNHLLGIGAGNDVQLGLAMDDAASQNYYRRLDTNHDFGDVPNRNRINALTRGYFGLAIQPHHEITIEVWPDAVRDFWNVIYPGCAIWLEYHNEAYTINSAHEVVSMEASIDLESNEIVTLNLNQVYPMYEESTHDIFPLPDQYIPKPQRYWIDAMGIEHPFVQAR